MKQFMGPMIAIAVLVLVLSCPSGTSMAAPNAAGLRLLLPARAVAAARAGARRVVRPPGAVIQGEIVGIRTAVRKPSVSDDMSMEQAGLAGGLYSIVTVRVDSLLTGDAPSEVHLYWNQYVRRAEDGRALHSSSGSDSGSDSGVNHPLLPGLAIIAHVAPNALEMFGGSVDREPGLWVFRKRPYFLSPFDHAVYREYTFSDELKDALLDGSLSSGLHDVYSMTTLLNETNRDEAIAELEAHFEAALEIWKSYQRRSRE